jgi:hypothetical protein
MKRGSEHQFHKSMRPRTDCDEALFAPLIASSSNVPHFLRFHSCLTAVHSSRSSYFKPLPSAPPFLPLSDLLNNVLRDTPQKENS